MDGYWIHQMRIDELAANERADKAEAALEDAKKQLAQKDARIRSLEAQIVGLQHMAYVTGQGVW